MSELPKDLRARVPSKAAFHSTTTLTASWPTSLALREAKSLMQ